MDSRAQLSRRFQERFSTEPTFAVRAPGRVNLIGEHIDYSGGLVLPMAIQREIRLVARPRDDDRFLLASCQTDESYQGPLATEPLRELSWVNYAFGVVHEFRKAGYQINGFEALYDSDIPLGSGLSSSAALEVATAWFLHLLVKSPLTRIQIAQLCQRAENEFVQVQSGIMDQAASALGERNAAIALDCGTLEYRTVPLAFHHPTKFLVVHSGITRGLSESDYNERRSQCDEAFHLISLHTRGAYHNLCEVPLSVLEAHRHILPGTLYQRAYHAISEEGRVSRAIAALEAGDSHEFGKLLNASHESLAVRYQVSIPELDELTSFLRSQSGVYGSRLTGAGFGGCTISLVDAAESETILEATADYLQRNAKTSPLAFLTTAEPGVSILE